MYKFMKNHYLFFCLFLFLFSSQTASAQDTFLNMSKLGQWDDDSIIPRGGLSYNEIWGYVDGMGNEYAILGSPQEINVIDVTDPTNPTLKQGFEGSFSSIWRDFKSYGNFVYGVHDGGSGTMEGLTILDMSALPAGTISIDTIDTDFGRSHNIFVDEPNSRLYIAGSNTRGNGLWVYDLSVTPDNPVLLKELNFGSLGGYVHDLFVRDNIAYCNSGSGENGGMWVYDLNDLDNVINYYQENTGGYNHSSWMTDDNNYVVYATETSNFPLYIVDVSDITNGNLSNLGSFKQPNNAPDYTNNIAHNPLIKGDFCYVSYYQDGVQVWDISNPNTPTLAGYYDMVSNESYSGTKGVWGVYPFLPSGNILASEEDGGLYVLRMDKPLYVDHTATGNNDGSSWTDAFTDLQSALAIGTNETIHVAAGTYKPTTGTGRGATFDIPHSATILGGYPNGGGTRNADFFNTILSGEINNLSSTNDNSFHVVRVKDAMDVVIDGVTITAGNANRATSFGRSRGAGLYVVNSTLTLENVTVEANEAIYGGGIFATLSPNVTFNNSLFENNKAEFGSALYHSNTTNMYIKSTRIINNNSTNRCAVEVNNSSYTLIENSIIANNASANANAIALVATNRNQTCDIYNSTILGETLNKNLITLQIGFGDQLDLNCYNSIIAHQNLSFDKAFIAFNNNILNLNTNNCYIQGSSVIGTSNNNWYSDTAGDLMLNADYSIAACSPAVDMGGDIYAGSLPTDIDGNPRFFGTVDIGAYEVQSACFSSKEKIIALETIEVYPNPVENILFVKTEIEEVQILIHTTLGQQIMETTSKEIDMGHLSNGIYYVSIFSKGALMETKKVVK